MRDYVLPGLTLSAAVIVGFAVSFISALPLLGAATGLFLGIPLTRRRRSRNA